MARHLLRGHWSSFFWNQSYGGTIETILTAGLFGVFGTSTLALKLVPTVLYAVAAVLVWRVGRRTVGERSARVAGALFWIWPAYFVWRSTKAFGFYSSGLVLGLVAMLTALRLVERDRRRDFIFLGLAFGLGWWASPQVLILALPSLIWLLWRRPRAARGWPWIVPAAVLGALPWLVANARHGWYSLHSEQASTSMVGHLHNLVSPNLQTALGLRVPFSLAWLVGPLAGWILFVLVLAACAAIGFRRRAGIAPLLLAGVIFLVLYVVSPYTYLTAEPRYLTFVLPIIVLVISATLRRPAPVIVGLAIACGMSIAGLAIMERQHLTLVSVDGASVPADFQPLIRTLGQARVHDVFASYWVAYRLGFESRERIIASPSRQIHYETVDGRVVSDLAHSRYARWDMLVRSNRGAAHVFVTGAQQEREARRLLLAAGYRRIEGDGFVVYLPPVGPTPNKVSRSGAGSRDRAERTSRHSTRNRPSTATSRATTSQVIRSRLITWW